MSMQDPVADMLTRVRNAQLMGIQKVRLPYSHLKNEILKLPHHLGLNVIAHQHKEKTITFPVTDDGILKTFNTVEEFNRLKDL